MAIEDFTKLRALLLLQHLHAGSNATAAAMEQQPILHDCLVSQ
jgi:hypothetical protein